MSRRAVMGAIAAGLALAGCAGDAALPAEAPVPAAFHGVRRVALLRRPDRAGALRPKDPLDALGESLAGRGLEPFAVDVGPGLAPALRPAARLFEEVDARVGTAPPGTGGPGRTPERMGRASTGEALDALRADAVAVYLRPDPLRPLLPPSSLLGPPALAPPRFATRGGSLALVARDGTLVWFDWGVDPLASDPGEPQGRGFVNAAEAVDAVVRVLAGPEADPDAP